MMALVMTPLAASVAGAALGVVSAGHCTLMCGPVAVLARARSLPSYFAGRIAAYGALGALAGSFGHVLAMSPWARWVERGLAVLFALVLLWSARRSSSAPLVSLGTKPRRSFVGAVLARVAEEPLLLGAATALLPCATLLAAVMAAAATGSALAGLLSMLAFSAVTGTVLIGAGGLLARLDKRVLMVAFVLGSGVWLLRAATPEPTASCPLHQGSSK